MVEFISLPDPRALLPPLLACLPAAFASPRPPPVLLPLLSPILRQRVQLLSSTTASSSSSDSWLRLLCWDAAKAERIQSIVDATTFEPHPVSGEIEIAEDVSITYKRFDEETLRSRIALPEYNLTVWYVWCGGDQDGGGPGWRVAQLLPNEGQTQSQLQPDSEDADDVNTWSGSIGEANERAQERLVEEALKAAEQQNSAAAPKEAMVEEEDDDDYWAQYDTTPARTPAVKQSSGLNIPTTLPGNGNVNTDDSYFARYSDVQPALDNDDPSTDKNEVGESSLNGDALAGILERQSQSLHAERLHPAPLYTNGFHHEDSLMKEESSKLLSHPRPSSASSSNGSDTVAKLELSAENQSASEMGVKQHIGANIKSLFRLAKSTGMPRAEFESIVKRELEVLCISDDDQ